MGGQQINRPWAIDARDIRDWCPIWKPLSGVRDGSNTKQRTGFQKAGGGGGGGLHPNHLWRRLVDECATETYSGFPTFSPCAFQGLPCRSLDPPHGFWISLTSF